MKFNLLLSPILILGLLSCSEDNDIVCPDILTSGISVVVFDSETRLPISCDSSVLIEDGDYFEMVTEVNLYDSKGNCLDKGSLQGAVGRPGSYSVIVSKSGYQDFTDTNVEVLEGECGVIPVEIDVFLSDSI